MTEKVGLQTILDSKASTEHTHNITIQQLQIDMTQVHHHHDISDVQNLKPNLDRIDTLENQFENALGENAKTIVGLKWSTEEPDSTSYSIPYAVAYNSTYKLELENGSNQCLVTYLDGSKTETHTISNTTPREWCGVVYGDGVFIGCSKTDYFYTVIDENNFSYNEISFLDKFPDIGQDTLYKIMAINNIFLLIFASTSGFPSYISNDKGNSWTKLVVDGKDVNSAAITGSADKTVIFPLGDGMSGSTVCYVGDSKFENWQQPIPVTEEPMAWYSIQYGNNTFVATIYDKPIVYVSKNNGSTWEPHTIDDNISDGNVTTSIFANGLFVLYVYDRSTEKGYFYHSVDGEQWDNSGFELNDIGAVEPTFCFDSKILNVYMKGNKYSGEFIYSFNNAVLNDLAQQIDNKAAETNNQIAAVESTMASKPDNIINVFTYQNYNTFFVNCLAKKFPTYITKPIKILNEFYGVGAFRMYVSRFGSMPNMVIYDIVVHRSAIDVSKSKYIVNWSDDFKIYEYNGEYYVYRETGIDCVAITGFTNITELKEYDIDVAKMNPVDLGT